MILAKHKAKGFQITFDSLKLFNIANARNEYSIVEKEVKQVKKPTIEDITYEVLEPIELDTSEVTVAEFMELFDSYTRDDLELFASDKRKTIATKAQKKLIQLNKK